jgi:hypothetical protein
VAAKKISKKATAKKPASKVVPPTPPSMLPDRRYRDNSTFYQGNPYDDKKNKMFSAKPTRRKNANFPGWKVEGTI